MDSKINSKWYLSQVHPSDFSKVPEGGIEFELGSDYLKDLDTVLGGHHEEGEECVVYNTFELEEEETLAFGMGADWWWTLYVNGEEIHTVFPNGNATPSFTANNHAVMAKCRKGTNVIAVFIRRGGSSWKFAFKNCDAVTMDPCRPVEVVVDPSQEVGPIKLMNAVNNGPIPSEKWGNIIPWRAAKIPYARNHDASFYAAYGGGHTVDVHMVFPNFDADPEDPASYDFTLTDKYLSETLSAGTKIFYRLGSKIEHEIKKYGTVVPKDFKKWAVICEHMIRHFNEGWADGHHMDIEYWEIWNEPDLTGKKTWQGTEEEFFELYRTAACHLKSCFPHLKIGGPALASNTAWMKRFLAAMTVDGKKIPMDFFSWHAYTTNPVSFAESCTMVREILDSYGYTDAESILNEWNYCRSFQVDFGYSMRQLVGIKGAAFTAACMCGAQDVPVDMLMYYDARPCLWNGLFDSRTYEPLKGYYPFLMWGKLVDMGTEIAMDRKGKYGLFGTAAKGKDGKIGIMLARYFEQDNLPGDLRVTLNVKDMDMRGATLYLVDETHTFEDIPYRMTADGAYVFDMPAHSVIYLEKAMP